QAADGIRDFHVTGVQTCALPISENRKNGRMNSMAHRLTSRLVSALVLNRKRIARISACLNTLSLKAPSSCVTKNGRKRRLPSSRICDGWLMTTRRIDSMTRHAAARSQRQLPERPAQQEETQQPTGDGRQQVAAERRDQDRQHA